MDYMKIKNIPAEIISSKSIKRSSRDEIKEIIMILENSEYKDLENSIEQLQ